MNESAVFPRPTQAVIQSDLRDLFRGAVRVVLEMCLDEAAKELVGARRYEASHPAATISTAPISGGL